LVDDSKSVISLLLNYYLKTLNFNTYKISKYAYGSDYHQVIKTNSKNCCFNPINYGDVSGRAFVDSAPILDRLGSVRFGMDWKNSNLITQK
jgi:epoxyqueuosine reductase